MNASSNEEVIIIDEDEVLLLVNEVSEDLASELGEIPQTNVGDAPSPMRNIFSCIW